ncbi:MAG TPA: ABC transporter ATP-binding protein [Bacillota bacterium]|nr:ABC transporter ATP-binding protein [Bacillota bacterium]
MARDRVFRVGQRIRMRAATHADVEAGSEPASAGTVRTIGVRAATTTITVAATTTRSPGRESIFAVGVDKTMSGAGAILEAQGLTKRFGAMCAANAISYALGPKEMAGIIGPNGAGKTTLFNLLTGVYLPDQGSVFFDGRRIARLSARQRVQLGIRRTFQLASTFDNLRVIDNLRLAHYQKQRQGKCSLGGMCAAHLSGVRDEGIDDYLEQLGLAKAAHMLVANLSLGSKRKLELAMALIGEPRVLLLDEPFAGLSEMEIDQIVHMLRARCAKRMAVLIIEHKITWLKDLVDRVSVLVNGEIIADGDYQAVLDSPATRKSYWRVG